MVRRSVSTHVKRTICTSQGMTDGIAASVQLPPVESGLHCVQGARSTPIPTHFDDILVSSFNQLASKGPSVAAPAIEQQERPSRFFHHLALGQHPVGLPRN
jgi:hypothetical protein